MLLLSPKDNRVSGFWFLVSGFWLLVSGPCRAHGAFGEEVLVS